jgi:hypothetical protein
MVFLVDNTPDNLDYMREIRFLGLNCSYQAPLERWWDTFDLCWEKILDFAHNHDCTHILSLEQDIIAPPHTIEIMLLASGAEKAVVTGRYRPRSDTSDAIDTNTWYETLGCCLFPTEFLYAQRYTLAKRLEVELFTRVRSTGKKLVRLQDELPLIHLTEPAVENAVE